MKGDELSALYSLAGQFCLACGAVEYELDRFFFGASDLFRSRLHAKFRGWPQQAQNKRKALAFICEDLMQEPPDPSKFGFDNFSEVDASVGRLYELRNQMFHGTPTLGLSHSHEWSFMKVVSRSDGDGNYCIKGHDISSSDIENEINSAEKLVLFLDACLSGLRRERGGWLSIDLTPSSQVIRRNLVERARQSTECPHRSGRRDRRP